MIRLILGIGILILILVSTVYAANYYVIRYRPTEQDKKVEGPGLGWNDDYAWYDKDGNFIDIKNTPQPAYSQ